MTLPLAKLLRASFVTAALVIASARDSSAIPFTCDGGDACNGATYALVLTDFQSLGGGDYFYEFLFGVDTTGYNGDSTDFLRAIAFKDVAGDYTNLALTDAPGGTSGWDVIDSGLNANGCKDVGEDGACAAANPTLNGGFGVPVSPSQQYFWTFTFNSTDGIPAVFGHIKYQYVADDKDKKDDFKKVGSLGSFDSALAVVPEPGSLLLLGSGLAWLGAWRRRTRRS